MPTAWTAALAAALALACSAEQRADDSAPRSDGGAVAEGDAAGAPHAVPEVPASCAALTPESVYVSDRASYFFCQIRPRGIFMMKSAAGDIFSYSVGADGKFPVSTTRDLVNWTSVPADAEPRAATWWRASDPGIWPMEVIERGGRFYMFYAAYADETQRPPPPDCGNNRFIGLAISEDADGPFVDLGRPLMGGAPYSEGGVPWGQIRTVDPNPFVDDDGQVYLYWSKPGGCYKYDNPRLGPDTSESRIYGARLSADLRHLASDPVLLLRPDQDWEYRVTHKHVWNEAPQMLKQDGVYYLMYSANSYLTENYAVGYGRSASPLGPFAKYPENPILESVDGIGKAGHNSVITSPDGRDVYTSYQSLVGRFISRIGRRADGTLYASGPYADISADDGGVRFVPKPSGAPRTDADGNLLGLVYDHGRDAAVAASSVAPDGAGPEAVTDGEIGIRFRFAMYDWAADGDPASAWIELAWDEPRPIDVVALYPSGAVMPRAIASGTLALDDGTALDVTFPDDPKAPAVLVLGDQRGPRPVRSLRFSFRALRGDGAAALSEIAALGPPPP